MNHDDIEKNRDRAGHAAADGAGGVPPADLTDADLVTLSAFMDGELPPADETVMHARLASDPLAANRVFAYSAQKSALQALCRASGEDPAPSPYLVLRRRDPWWLRFGMAAAWCVAGAGVALAAATFVPRGGSGDSGAGSVFAAGEPDTFARRADVAYAVYTPEQRHPVEVGAADEAHLVAWLSKRLGKPLSVPSLQEYGYSLVGGRLLPGASGPAAQFMYENDGGERLTLYVGSSGKDTTRVHLLSDGNRRTFYWTTDRMGYALSGPPTEGHLRDIAYEVCGALGGKPSQW
ncbi:anti-sigma factor family protein [Paraburkholderia adhaesiva]|uniref:anti-sigma factor family protein n=1 Tax=Paraburkholderia adhaesiva TaxID=2883244 RepID=UPI001F2DEFDA|nr:anti-sigma factor [Paraburkholderia adhaesiva]